MPHLPPSGPSKFKKIKRELSYYAEGIRQKNNFILAEAITLIESTLPGDIALANQLLTFLSTYRSETSIRIAVTGSPGAGKSTFIDYIGMYWISEGKRVSVLSIDPSSTLSSGSILGDKTRMETLSNQKNAFIRPTASGQHLGGISSRTREAILLCEAAGFDKIVIETVGIGQNEADVAAITDVNLFLLQPCAGDDLQGIKRGVLEKADICIVHKADGDLLASAEETIRNYRQSLHYFHHVLKDWIIPVHKVSSLQKTGLEEVIRSLDAFVLKSKESGYFDANRKEQEMRWFEKQTYEQVNSWAKQFLPLQTIMSAMKEKIKKGEISVEEASRTIGELLEKLRLEKR